MRELLGERDVQPLYAQVIAQDAGTADIPSWDTGEEHLVASEHAVLIATRPDHAGPVHIQIFRGHAGDNPGTQIFDGELTVTSGSIEVGSTLGNQVLKIPVDKPGYVTMKVFVDPVKLPEYITVVLENGC
jgi:hypothetical protein